MFFRTSVCVCPVDLVRPCLALPWGQRVFEQKRGLDLSAQKHRKFQLNPHTLSDLPTRGACVEDSQSAYNERLCLMSTGVLTHSRFAFFAGDHVLRNGGFL